MKKYIPAIIGMSVSAAIGLVVLAFPPDAPRKPVAAPRAGERMTDEYFKYVVDLGGYRCQQAIQATALHGFRWTKWMFGRFAMFDVRGGYLIPGHGVLLMGDDAEAQNGLGNWLQVKYFCEYDPASETVIKAYFEELPWSAGTRRVR